MRPASLRIAIAAVAVCAGAAAHAADSSGFDAAFAAHVAAVQARDMAALERTITSGNELTLILPNGARTSTRRAYLDFHRTFFASSTWTIRFEPVARFVGPDFVVLTTRSDYRDIYEGKPIRTSSWVTFTFRREGGSWRLIHDQNTRVPPGS